MTPVILIHKVYVNTRRQNEAKTVRLSKEVYLQWEDQEWFGLQRIILSSAQPPSKAPSDGSKCTIPSRI